MIPQRPDLQVRPGKKVIWIGSLHWGHGPRPITDLRQFYEHPELFGLVGYDTRNMLEKVASFFKYPGGGKALDEAVCFGDESKMEDWS